MGTDARCSDDVEVEMEVEVKVEAAAERLGKVGRFEVPIRIVVKGNRS